MTAVVREDEIESLDSGAQPVGRLGILDLDPITMEDLPMTVAPGLRSAAEGRVPDAPKNVEIRKSPPTWFAGVCENCPERDQFALALAKVIADFAASPENLDSQFEPALSCFVSVLSLERGTIYLSDTKKVYSWARPGIPTINSTPVVDFPYTRASIEAKGFFAYTLPDELPTSAVAEREYYRENGPMSLVVLPLIAAGTVVGGVAFETITYNRTWPAELMPHLKLLADLFASGLVISKAKKELVTQLRFERCISDVSASLVNLRGATADQCVKDALAEIGHVLRLERIGVFERVPSESFVRTHVWTRDGLEPIAWSFLQDYVGRFAPEIFSNRAFHCNSLSELPAELSSLRDHLGEHGVNSFVILPLRVGARIEAAMTIAAAEETHWDTDLLRRITILGESLANALTRSRQDELIAAHQDRLRLAMHATKSHGWDWNIESGESIWFGASETIFGLPAEAHTGGIDEFKKFLHPDDRKSVQDALERAIREHVPYEAEYRIVRADGQVRWLSDRGEVLCSRDGRPSRMIGIAVDISDKKAVDQARAAAETRYGQLLESVEAIVWRADPASLGFSFVSRQAEAILGYPVQHWVDNSDFWRNHIHPDDRDWVIKACCEAVVRGKDYVLEYRMVASDGRVVWLHDKIRLVMNQAKPVELIGIMVDVTALKDAEQRLRVLGNRLIEGQELERNRIARELHDDINQRLALIAIDLEQLNKKRFRTQKEIRTYGSALWTRTSEVTSQISRLCGHLHSSKLEHLGLVAALRDLCAGIVQRQSIKIRFSTKSLPRHLPDDVSLCLFRICQESLANIARHSGCSQVAVRISVKNGEVELGVTDNGRGFDVETRVGSGLGLISMQERSSLLGGRFSIRSVPGAGTTVLASLPLHKLVKGTTKEAER